MEEIWKEIVETSGRYFISNYGNVKRYDGLIMKPFKTKCGYIEYNLRCNGKDVKKYAHRLVAKYFIPKIDGKEEVNHIDCDKSNNFVLNLEWCNRKENMEHYSDVYQKNANNRVIIRDKNRNGIESVYYKCPICGGKMSVGSKNCRICKIENVYKNKPDKETLKKNIRCGNIRKVAELYSVTDSTVRKWCKHYGLPSSSMTIRNTSDYGWSVGIYNDKQQKEKTKQNKSVILLLEDESEIYFNSILSAIKFCKERDGKVFEKSNVNTKHVSDACDKKRKRAYGYRWKWPD